MAVLQYRSFQAQFTGSLLHGADSNRPHFYGRALHHQIRHRRRLRSAGRRYVNAHWVQPLIAPRWPSPPPRPRRRLEIQLRGGLRRDGRHQRETAIQLHPRQRAFQAHRAHRPVQTVAHAGSCGASRVRATSSARMQATPGGPGSPVIHGIAARRRPRNGQQARLRGHASRPAAHSPRPRDSATCASAGWRKTSATGPVWRMRPSTITAIQSPSAMASMRSCVTTMLGTPPDDQHAPQFVARAHARGGIQRRKRLVQQQQRGLGGQRARQRHALLLAAGNARADRRPARSARPNAPASRARPAGARRKPRSAPR